MYTVPNSVMMLMPSISNSFLLLFELRPNHRISNRLPAPDIKAIGINKISFNKDTTKGTAIKKSSALTQPSFICGTLVSINHFTRTISFFPSILLDHLYG